MSEHVWNIEDAVQGTDGDEVLELSWRCVDCGKAWGTMSGVTMPNEEAGECS
jgi:hypothetical protein